MPSRLESWRPSRLRGRGLLPMLFAESAPLDLRIVGRTLRELPVVDDAGRVIGFLDEADIAQVYVSAAGRADNVPTPVSGGE